MCGRFTLATPTTELERLFGIAKVPAQPARYNIAPGQPILMLVISDGHEPLGVAGERRLARAQWGLVPGWADDPHIGNHMINARAETIADKPAFRDPFRHRRCVIPADGFYEWQTTPHGRQAFLFLPRDHHPLAFAGLWERWYSPRDAVAPDHGPSLLSCTIITTSANATLRPVHDRMPAILAPEEIGRWLDPATGRTDALGLLRPCPDDVLERRAVSERVNNPRHDDRQCLAPPAQPSFDFSAA